MITLFSSFRNIEVTFENTERKGRKGAVFCRLRTLDMDLTEESQCSVEKYPSRGETLTDLLTDDRKITRACQVECSQSVFAFTASLGDVGGVRLIEKV